IAESTSGDDQNRNSSAFENGESTDCILSKPAVKFVKAAERPFQETTQDLMIILIQRVQRLERELKARTPNVDRGRSSSKRVGDELEQESAKRQKLEKEDDFAELKRCLELVPEDDDDVTIKATLLSSKSPTIVDYKIYKEGKKSYFKIIRADG
nr:hypothetical protein [Tanacetum cinerariifolium]